MTTATYEPVKTRAEADALAAKMRTTGLLKRVHVKTVKISGKEYWWVSAVGPDASHPDANDNVGLDSFVGLETWLRVLPKKYKKEAV